MANRYFISYLYTVDQLQQSRWTEAEREMLYRVVIRALAWNVGDDGSSLFSNEYLLFKVEQLQQKRLGDMALPKKLTA